MNNLIYIFVGGGLGSLFRYGVSVFIKIKFEPLFPFATLCSNIASCILLALAVGVFSEKMMANPSLKAFILVGVCGGFSTFSTFSYETVDLFKTGNHLYAITNIAISIIACVGIVYFMTKNT
jgi:CrcB protein